MCVCVCVCVWLKTLLPRRAYAQRGLAVARCVSVRPSVCHTPVFCLLESFALTQHATVSTHRLGGILDVVVTKSDDTPSSLQVDDIGLSDHHLITWSVNVRKTTTPNYVTSERRPWKNLDVAQFRSALRSSSLCTDDTTGTDLN